MLRIKEAIIVEGRYDKGVLANIVDTLIITTDGFHIFNDRERLNYIRALAERRGIIVLTDGDGAGFVIRRYLKGAIDPAQVKHAYIPDIPGRERRKRVASKEGKLGVEGMSAEVLLRAVRACGATVLDEDAPVTGAALTKADLFADGLSGRENSAELRRALLKKLALPERLTANGLLDALNAMCTREEYAAALRAAIESL
jgi:ribonuclease M5